jgi:acetyltransferase-like isoleucine patch superfamily enzyme
LRDVPPNSIAIGVPAIPRPRPAGKAASVDTP